MTACACDEFSTNVTFRQSTIYGSATTPNVGRAFMYYDEPLRDALVLLGPGNTNFATISTEVEPTADGVARRAIVIRTQDPANPATALERARFSSKPHPNLRLGNRHLPGTSGRLALETSNLSLGGSTAWEWFTDQPVTNTYDLYLRENSGVPAITVTSGTGRIGVARTDPVARLDIQGGGVGQGETDAERGIRLTAASVDMRLFADLTRVGGAFIGTRSEHRLSFYTYSDASSGDYKAATKLTVLANGNVGIGSLEPTRKLEIVSDTEGEVIRFRRSDNQEHPAAIGTTQYGKGLIFYTANNERMRIEALGNVGIGINEPQAKLHIAGSATPNVTALQVSGPPANQGYTAKIVGSMRVEGALDVTGNLQADKVYGAVYG